MRCVSPPSDLPHDDEYVAVALNVSVNGQDVSTSGAAWTYYPTADEFQGAECAERGASGEA